MRSVTYNDGRTFTIGERVSYRPMYTGPADPHSTGTIVGFSQDCKVPKLPRTTVLIVIRDDGGQTTDTCGGCVRKLEE